MKTRNEIDAMLDKLSDAYRELNPWDEAYEQACCMIDALLWIIGDESGRSIDPDVWMKEENE